MRIHYIVEEVRQANATTLTVNLRRLKDPPLFAVLSVPSELARSYYVGAKVALTFEAGEDLPVEAGA